MSHLLTSAEAADRVRMLRVRLERLAKDGAIPHVALPDGEIRFEVDALDAWIAQHRRSPSTTEEGPDGK